MKHVYGVDVGGTTIKIGRLTTDGRLRRVWEIPTDKTDDGAGVPSDIAEAVRADMKEAGLTDSDVLGAGVAAPGAVNADGVISRAVNIGWGRFNLKETLKAALKLPVTVANDANAAALGEYWKGGGFGFRHMLLVTLGTGVGGGVIVDGRIVTGAVGAAGEIGHLHLKDDETEHCGCGKCGCFEQYASATGAVRLAAQVLEESGAESVLRGKDYTCADIFAARAAGDAVATEATARYGYYLGKGLALCATLLNPEAIVIGGGVSKAGDVLIDLLMPSFKKYTYKESADCAFRFASLGNNAGVYGAARLIIDP